MTRLTSPQRKLWESHPFRHDGARAAAGTPFPGTAYKAKILYHIPMTSADEWNSYGRMNASQRWRKQSAVMGSAATEAIVEEARIERGQHVLDVASGTGEPAISIATRLNGTGRVIATDITAESLEVGKLRARERNLKNIEFQIADVHQLPFPDATFDRVTCRLGAMFFADLPQAFREIRRVLKPGGRVTILAWGSMDQPYFRSTVGTVLDLLTELEVPPGAARMFRLGNSGVLSTALCDAGFIDVEEAIRTIPWTWPGTAEEAWEYFQAVTAPFKPVLEAIPADRRAEVDAAVVRAIRKHETGGEIRFNAEFVFASATR